MKKIVRFRQIDSVALPDHFHLNHSDKCYYMYEFTSGGGYGVSDNQLIANLKKKPNTSSQHELNYKRRALNLCSNNFRLALTTEFISAATFVPIPPSKTVDHVQYDDRMERLCRGIDESADVRNIVKQTESMIASHERGQNPRPTVDELMANYEIDNSLVSDNPGHLAVVDDVLTAGTHFKAIQRVLLQRLPEAKIIGLFVARRVFKNDNSLDGGVRQN